MTRIDDAFDGRKVFECGVFDVVYFVRGRRVKEGTITPLPFTVIFLIWSWHFPP